MASKRGQSFLSLIKKSASPKTSVRPRPSPGVNSISLASGCACVPRNLIGKFLSDSVIDSILRLQHPRICAGPNEVWLPTTTQEFNHTWESEQARVWAGEGGSGDGEHSKVRGELKREDTVRLMWTAVARQRRKSWQSRAVTDGRHETVTTAVTTNLWRFQLTWPVLMNSSGNNFSPPGSQQPCAGRGLD